MVRVRRAPSLLAAILVLAVAPTPAWFAHAQPTGADPASNRSYEHADYQQWVARFERPGREVFDQRRRIVSAMGLRPGMVVADIGAGTGLFTRLFSPLVGPNSKVIAVDISRVFIDNILRTAREQGLRNIEGVVNTQKDTLLPVASIDLAFTCDSYHHFEHPQAMLRSIHEALRGGFSTLVVVDFQRNVHSSDWIKGHVHVPQETVIKEIEAAGFKLVGEENFLQENYFLRFARR